MDQGKLIQLIARGEGRTIEFKVRLRSQARLARSICAFANSQGGVIIAGVDDDGRIVGVDAPEQTDQGFHSCLDCIDPRPDILVGETSVGDAVLVSCMVSKGKEKPYRVVSPRDSTIFIRTGSCIQPVAKGRHLADEDDLRRKLKLSPLHKAVLKTIGGQAGIRLDSLCARHNLSRHRTIKLLVPLIKAGVLMEKDGGYILR
jgi:predicted HTH transcriptional regulator